MDYAKRRWSVTFTKHIKQKRKVYQDGFLDLDISTKKVKLYDDCEKLLECRILKNDEVISSGETLAFNAYSVAIGDPEGDCKHMPNFSYQGRCKKKPQPSSQSPSHKIIREFKKREAQKYGTPLGSPEIRKPRMTEWQVLYTTQLTQKAKKYHDGFLQLTASGSQGRQIMLFDETRKLLDSRFVRRDEEIRSGESIAFDGHLVEVGDCEENSEPVTESNVQGNNGNTARKSEGMHKQQSCVKTELRKIEVPTPDTKNPNITEWQVMYTDQVTQKAKRYRDGFLKLAISGSLQRQVMLYDDNWNLLNSRFLKKDEKVKSGESIMFNAHLVDIGEPQANHQFQMDLNIQGNNRNVVRRKGIAHEEQNCLKVNKSAAKGKPQNDARSRENADSTFSISSVDGVESCKSVSTNKPLRNAIQILSILQKPKASGSVDAGFTGNSIAGQTSSSNMLQVSDAVDGIQPDSELPVPHDEQYKNVDTVRSHGTDIGKCPDLKSFKMTSTIRGSQSCKATDIKNFNQSHSDVKGSTDRKYEAFVVGPDVGGETNSFAEPKSDKMDEFPSFDLRV